MYFHVGQSDGSGFSLTNVTYTNVFTVLNSDLAACIVTLQPTRSPSISIPLTIAPTIANSPSTSSELLSCVKEESQLRKRIGNTLSGLSIPSSIELCFDTITLQNEITITKKNIRLYCNMSNTTKKCLIDGKRVTRHFNITNSFITFEGVIFSNGKATTPGLSWINSETSQGGFLLAYNSTINMMDCDFTNNTAACGGAISTEQTNIDMTRCNMIENDADNGTSFGFGGAIFGYDSPIKLIGSDDALSPTIFAKNTSLCGGWGHIFCW
jgi:hypothetical protein